MQSLLSTIHHSLSQTRATFALRVFVSYDALGRRKESLLVDIEQPRPPTHHTPLHTIRILTSVAPLVATPLSASLSAVTAPPIHSTSLPLHSTLPTIQPAHTAPPSTNTSPSHPSVAPASLPSLSHPPPAPAAAPLSAPSSSPSPPPHSRPLPGQPPLSLSTAPPSSSPTPTAASTVLPLPPHGIEDAVDDEMADEDSTGGRMVHPCASQGVSAEATAPPTDPQQRLAGQKRKRKERKKRSKERARQREAKRASEAKSEKEKWDDRSEPDELPINIQEVPVRLVGGDSALRSEYARRLAAIRGAGGFASLGAFRQLAELIEEEVKVLEASGRDWGSTYNELEHVVVQVCISDADLPIDDYSDEDDGGLEAWIDA